MRPPGDDLPGKVGWLGSGGVSRRGDRGVRTGGWRRAGVSRGQRTGARSRPDITRAVAAVRVRRSIAPVCRIPAAGRSNRAGQAAAAGDRSAPAARLPERDRRFTEATAAGCPRASLSAVPHRDPVVPGPPHQTTTRPSRAQRTALRVPRSGTTARPARGCPATRGTVLSATGRWVILAANESGKPMVPRTGAPSGHRCRCPNR